MLATGEEGVTRNGSAGAKQYRIPNSGKSAEPGDDGRSERQNKQLSAARIANLNASLDPDRPFATMLWTISSRTLSMASLQPASRSSRGTKGSGARGARAIPPCQPLRVSV